MELLAARFVHVDKVLQSWLLLRGDPFQVPRCRAAALRFLDKLWVQHVLQLVTSGVLPDPDVDVGLVGPDGAVRVHFLVRFIGDELKVQLEQFFCCVSVRGRSNSGEPRWKISSL